MSIHGQYFCKSCMKPIPHVRNEGKCDSCIAKEARLIRAGNYCDHCGKNATQSMIYINRKTKKRYCVDCRAIFRQSLIESGKFTPDQATKIMVQDFVLTNDPRRTKKKR